MHPVTKPGHAQQTARSAHAPLGSRAVRQVRRSAVALLGSRAVGSSTNPTFLLLRMSKGVTCSLGTLSEDRVPPSRPTVDLLQGSLDVIVLQTLSWQPMHGFGIARWIQRVTDDVFQIEEGTLYPALYKIENKGWVKGEWRITENNRRAKYYRLTAAGKRRLAEESRTWNLFAGAMAKIMTAVPTPV